MDFIVKDSNFIPLAVIDTYESAIWTERYSELGDFELNVPLDTEYLSALLGENYLFLKDSDRVMLMDYLNIDSDISSGKKKLVVKGHSIETILERRIIWQQTIFNDTVENVLRKMLTDNLINPDPNNNDPEQAKRKINNFVFPTVTDQAVKDVIDGVTIKCQFTGDTLYEAIKTICDQFYLGFKITINSSNQFVFSLYRGMDRTSGQSDRDAIIFSPHYDTLINSRYVNEMRDYRNVALVLGEDAGQTRRRTVVYKGDTEPEGLDRRELYVDARDLQSETDSGTTLPDDEYVSGLANRGQSKLNEHSVSTVFDGQIETHFGPQYGTDYYLGDFVTAINEIGLGATAQITEYIRGYDDKGYRAYPTFTMIA